jgi:hypothetical protein
VQKISTSNRLAWVCSYGKGGRAREEAETHKHISSLFANILLTKASHMTSSGSRSMYHQGTVKGMTLGKIKNLSHRNMS